MVCICDFIDWKNLDKTVKCIKKKRSFFFKIEYILHKANAFQKFIIQSLHRDGISPTDKGGDCDGSNSCR